MNQFMGNALHKNRAVVRSEIHPLVSFNFYAPRILPEKSNCIHSKAQNQKSSLLPNAYVYFNFKKTFLTRDFPVYIAEYF